MKQTIRLNESQFNRLVKETVKQILKEELVNKTDGRIFSYSDTKSVDTPYVGDGKWKWKYTGDKVDRMMWALKKKAQEKQKKIDIWNKYADMISNGQITKDKIPQVAYNLGVLNGRRFPDAVRADGWPTMDFIIKNLPFNQWAEDGDIGMIDENYDLETLYSLLSDVCYRNMLGREDRYRDIR